MEDLKAAASAITPQEWVTLGVMFVQFVCVCVQIWAWAVIRRCRLSSHR